MRPYIHSHYFSMLTLTAMLLLVITRAGAEDMLLVRDVNSNPRALTNSLTCVVGSTEFLFASDVIRGTELWVGDGLQGTTKLVKDINPGSGDGVSPTECASIGNVLIFIGSDGVNGRELWRSDGTADGTFLVKEVLPGPDDGATGGVTVLNNLVLFVANDGVSGSELWRTDGTAAGTSLVKDINPGAGDASINAIVRLNDSTVAFTATSTANGTELWKSDGTDGGTTIISDIVPGTSSSFPLDLSPIPPIKLFFSADTAAQGREPWVTDGTPGGTFILKDIAPGAGDGYYANFGDLGQINGKVIFTGIDPGVGFEPFVSDGTIAGTGLLKDLDPAGNSFPREFYTLGDKLIFGAMTTLTGREVYVSDGTTGGTTLLAEINPGVEDGAELYQSRKTLSGDRLIFRGGITESGASRAYSTDGSSITLLTDLFPGAASVIISYLQPATSAGIAFGPPSPVASIPEPGLFLTDGTAAGTITHPGGLSGFTDSSVPIPMGELNGRLIFAADDGSTGMELWSTDGTDAGTSRITDINVGPASSVMPQVGFAILNNKLFFAATDSTNGGELWSTDGTSAGTMLVKDIEPGTGSAFRFESVARKFFVVGNKLVFAAHTAASGDEPWVSDGTSGGTTILLDIWVGTNSGLPGRLEGAVSTSLPGGLPTLFFIANNGLIGEELWATTTTVTGLTFDLNPGMGGSDIESITPIPVGSSFSGVMFHGCNLTEGCEPRISLGGVPSFIDVEPGNGNSEARDFTFVSPNRVFFLARKTGEGFNLWRSDAPFNAASVVRDVIPGAGDFFTSEITKLNSSTVIFMGCGVDGGDDCEPWRSDGTSGGTVQIKDLFPGPDSSGAQGFGVLNEVAYFLAYDGATENYVVKYFRSDGTSDGTFALTNPGLFPFTTEYLPSAFTEAAGTLFFGAYASSFGFELFKIGEDECPSDVNKAFPGLCGCGVLDEDLDGDGAVDCLEECPSDSDKQLQGACGCGIADTDGSANGIADCLDDISVITPPKPKVKFANKKKSKVNVEMTPQFGATHQLFYIYKPIGQKPIKGDKFKKKKSVSSTAALKAPEPGFSIFVKYRYTVPDTKIKSKFSKYGKKARK